MVLTAEANEVLTKVGPGTPGGELLRRYWQPVAFAEDLTDEKPRKRLRILGEDLVLYRKEHGGYALIAEQCAHRLASLFYGFVEGDDIRCAYHGWKYAPNGQCLEQPFEPDNRRFKEGVRLAAYPVQEYAGLLFAYFGPDPAPVLPRWDVLERRDGTLRLRMEPVLECNWLQPMENSVDTVHTFWLHGHTMRVKGLPGGEYYYRPIEKYDFEMCEWGIIKRRFYRDDQTGEVEAEHGHPLVFPNMLRVPEGPRQAFHWRVPVDDDRTLIFWAGFTPSKDGSVPDRPDRPPVDRQGTLMTADGSEYAMDTFQSQDKMAWETQGRIFDRTKERLGAEDKGIAMYRRLLWRQIELVQKGGTPMALIHDESRAVVDFETSTGQARPEFVTRGYE